MGAGSVYPQLPWSPIPETSAGSLQPKGEELRCEGGCEEDRCGTRMLPLVASGGYTWSVESQG